VYNNNKKARWEANLLSIVFFIKTEKKISKEKINFFSLFENGIFSKNEKIKYLNNESFKSIKWDLIKLNSKFTFIDNSLIKNQSENIFTEKLNIKPIAIKQIYIRNFKGISNLQIKLPIDCQWIFLTGENASGKTSILQAVVLGLYDKDGHEFQNLTKNSLVKQNTQIAIEVYKNNENIINDTLNNDNFYEFNELAAYSPIRINFSDNEKNTTPSQTFFAEPPKIFNIEEKLKKLSKEDFDFFVSIYKHLISNLIDIKKDNSKRFKTEIIYREVNNKENIRFQELAMGMRSIIGFIGDLLIKLSQEKDIKETKEIEGIVIIDEFDNHLHPKWQRMLVEKLTNLFPKVQFIVSTHSPIPLLGAPPERTVILNVNRTKVKGITVRRLEKLEKELKYLLPNQLLTSDIFGLEEIENVYLDDNELDKVPIEDKYDDIEKNKALMEDLERRANNKELFPDDLFNDKKV